MKFLQAFISNLYRGGADIPAEDFQTWALNELKALIPFDAAVWGMGNARRARFHNVMVQGLPSSYATAIEQTTDINPIFAELRGHIGRASTMDDVFPDDEFYASELYHRTFSPFGVERILSIGHADPRSGLYTLLSLYRFDRERPFTSREKDIHEAASYHLAQAYSHVFFLHLTRPKSKERHKVSAVVDKEGTLHEAEPAFIDLLERHFPHWKGMDLPFELHTYEDRYLMGNLYISVRPMADLFLVRMREQGPLDELTPREREVVFAVCKGLSHKEIGRQLGLAPTTVSSHLYRAYGKLGVESRSALARIVHHQI